MFIAMGQAITISTLNHEVSKHIAGVASNAVSKAGAANIGSLTDSSEESKHYAKSGAKCFVNTLHAWDGLVERQEGGKIEKASRKTRGKGG
ncbi:MAG: hypothetical protein Q9219_006749 [cf. Caloplaca sp. 3 TL-2023]